MLREILSLLPQGMVDRPPALLLAAAGAGAVLAVVGGRFTRSLVTLSAVGAGAVLGLHAPAWFGLSVDAIGAAFCGAIVLGVSGFVLHRTWIGLLLSTLLMTYAGVFTWIMLAGDVKWSMPQLDGSQDMPAILSTIWRSLPAALYPSLPIAIFVAAALGILVAVLWPRVARVACCSVLGGGVLVVAGGLATQKNWPQVYNSIPDHVALELAIFLGFLLLASCIQWVFLPRRGSKSGSKNSSAADADAAENPPIAPLGFATSAFPIDQKRQETAARRQRTISTRN